MSNATTQALQAVRDGAERALERGFTASAEQAATHTFLTLAQADTALPAGVRVAARDLLADIQRHGWDDGLRDGLTELGMGALRQLQTL